MDWNNDGKKDLLVGDSLGSLWIFLNTGTDARPSLAAAERVQVDGKDFTPDLLRSFFKDSIKRWHDVRIKPEVTDWNNDGKKDVIVGVEGGYVFLLLNTGKADEPQFDRLVPLRDGDGYLRPRKRLERVCPSVCDWNADGKKDLLLANEFGYVYFYPNVGSDAAPVFDGCCRLSAQGQPLCPPPSSSRLNMDMDGDGNVDTLSANNYGEISIGYTTKQKISVKGQDYKSRSKQCTTLAVTDWNNDGKNDLLLGHVDGTVELLLNAGLDNPWEFSEPVMLQDGEKVLQGGPGVAVAILDGNGDGKKDLQCMDHAGNTILFENQGTDAQPTFNGSHGVEIDKSMIFGGFRSRLDIVDWNNDGRLDLLYSATKRDWSTRIYVLLARERDASQ